MNDIRKGELALAFIKTKLRKQLLKHFSLKVIDDIKCYISNVVKEPEFVAVQATSAELLELLKVLFGEAFAEYLKKK